MSPLLRWLPISLALLTIALDQVGKWLALQYLRGEPIHSYLGDTVRLQYARNTGAFLGMGAALPDVARIAIFTVGTGAILVICVVIALRRHWPRAAVIGLPLVFAGGISNLIDRVLRGSVVDYFNMGIGAFRTGIFNVADMAILLGVGFLLFSHESTREESDAGSPSPAQDPFTS
ncbi:MAG: signal peptidase II [Candidatus Eisenbacteria bacterium]|uniref:Lipoprotein signal peptidase n=1 Tax=Eiseniibacteriota bacterium TaxID=2212470 RepID=A0A956LWW8_UNCEI|nr:signal peptidase II [Candidatus Eisenbacteria bacterium]